MLSPKYIYSVNICKHCLLGEFGQHILDAFRFKPNKPNTWVPRSFFRPCAPILPQYWLLISASHVSERKAIACVTHVNVFQKRTCAELLCWNKCIATSNKCLTSSNRSFRPQESPLRPLAKRRRGQNEGRKTRPLR